MGIVDCVLVSVVKNMVNRKKFKFNLFNNCKIMQQTNNRENVLEKHGATEGVECDCCDGIDMGVWGGC